MPKIQPPFLKKGDLILVISPSGRINEDRFQKGIEIIKSYGFRVELGQFATREHFKYAGTHQERLHDLQWALDHSEAKAIICGRGGYGMTHIVDSINWNGFKSKPKWVVGFSDITALHFALYNQGYCSIHGPVVQILNEIEERDVDSLFHLLEGKESINHINHGSFKGLDKEPTELIGGNLALMVNQICTPTDIDFNGKVLFIEEIGEYLYHIDRMLLQLKRANKLAQLQALIVGTFSDNKETKEEFGLDVEGIIRSHCESYGYPLIFDFPAGHANRNFPLVHGGEIHFN